MFPGYLGGHHFVMDLSPSSKRAADIYMRKFDLAVRSASHGGCGEGGGGHGSHNFETFNALDCLPSAATTGSTPE